MAPKVTFVNKDNEEEAYKLNLVGEGQNQVQVCNVLTVFGGSAAILEDGSLLEADDHGLSFDVFEVGSTYFILIKPLHSNISQALPEKDISSLKGKDVVKAQQSHCPASTTKSFAVAVKEMGSNHPNHPPPTYGRIFRKIPPVEERDGDLYGRAYLKGYYESNWRTYNNDKKRFHRWMDPQKNPEVRRFFVENLRTNHVMEEEVKAYLGQRIGLLSKYDFWYGGAHVPMSWELDEVYEMFLEYKHGKAGTNKMIDSGSKVGKRQKSPERMTSTFEIDMLSLETRSTKKMKNKMAHTQHTGGIEEVEAKERLSNPKVPLHHSREIKEDGRKFETKASVSMKGNDPPQECKNKEKQIFEYRGFLARCAFIKASTRWRDVAEQLQDDPRCSCLDLIDQVECFTEYTKDLLLVEHLYPSVTQDKKNGKVQLQQDWKTKEHHDDEGFSYKCTTDLGNKPVLTRCTSRQETRPVVVMPEKENFTQIKSSLVEVPRRTKGVTAQQQKLLDLDTVVTWALRIGRVKLVNLKEGKNGIINLSMANI